jgi:hypothetical protein
MKKVFYYLVIFLVSFSCSDMYETESLPDVSTELGINPTSSERL